MAYHGPSAGALMQHCATLEERTEAVSRTRGGGGPFLSIFLNIALLLFSRGLPALIEKIEELLL